MSTKEIFAEIEGFKGYYVSNFGKVVNEKGRELNSPVWWDIVQSNTLNRVFNDPESERHICPLQLDVIERCLKMYSKEGDTVFTPFLGIGSEIYQAVKMGRKGIGIELKPEYFQQAKKNLMTLDNDDLQMDFESYFGLTT